MSASVEQQTQKGEAELLPPVPAPFGSKPMAVGRVRIQIIDCFLNVKAKHPYVIITLGDQTHRTSTSEFSEGRWNECFELGVTFHAQLFGTIQLDLYENYTLYPDKHIGRAEIRLSSLEKKPETTMTYYEVWHRKFCTGASSSYGREKAAANHIGMIKAKISYRYVRSEDDQSFGAGDPTAAAALTTETERNGMNGGAASISTVEEKLAAEFKRKLQLHRERRNSGLFDAIPFKKIEEKDDGHSHHHHEHSGLDTPDESDLSEIDESIQSDISDDEHTVAPRSIQRPLTLSKSRANSGSYHGIEHQMHLSSLDSNMSAKDVNQPAVIGAEPNHAKSSSSWARFHKKIKTTMKELKMDPESYKAVKTVTDNHNAANEKESDTTEEVVHISQVIKTIWKLLASLQQGFELSKMQAITGLTVLERFYTDLPRSRTWDLVESLSEIEDGARFWKFAMASYGWKGLNFIKQGKGILTDVMREHADAKSVVEYLCIPKDDLLAYEFRSAAAFRPSYFIARDRFTNSIVLSIRGTMSVMDTLTDLVCEYEPWKGGFVHSGMKNSAIWFFRNIAPQLIAYSNEHSTTGLIIVGHSLGAATAAILTIILMDYIEEFRRGKDEFNIQCFGYAPACGLSLELAEKYKDCIQSFVFADDMVSKLSYGTVMDIKDLLIASAEGAKHMGLTELIWSGNLAGEKWKAAFKQIAEVRKHCLENTSNPKLYVAGKVFQFWLDPTPSNDTRIVVERTTATKVCSELVLKKSILFDHLPTNFDVAFRRARETLMMEGALNLPHPDKADGTLNAVPSEGRTSVELNEKVQEAHQEETDKNTSETIEHPLWKEMEKLGLKSTTHRGGGEGKVLGNEASR